MTSSQARGRDRRSRRGKERASGKPFDRDEPHWIYGLHAVKAALANPRRKLSRLVATRNAARELAASAAPEILEPSAIDALLPPGAVHQGVALLTEPLAQPELRDLLTDGESATLLFLDQVTDPHNIGAILRSAAAFGAIGVVTTLRHAPPVTGVLAKAASGALEHVPYVQVINLAEALRAARDAGYLVLGLDETGEPLEPAAQDERIALVLGAEGAGLRELTRKLCDKLVRLRTTGPIGSLNVSNAAAVALYAITRQE